MDIYRSAFTWPLMDGANRGDMKLSGRGSGSSGGGVLALCLQIKDVWLWGIFYYCVYVVITRGVPTPFWRFILYDPRLMKPVFSFSGACKNC